MDEIKFEAKLKELMKEFGAGSERKEPKLAGPNQNSGQTAVKDVDGLHESLDYLRICIKYQIFDLEATRRENKYLRQLLEENNR